MAPALKCRLMFVGSFRTTVSEGATQPDNVASCAATACSRRSAKHLKTVLSVIDSPGRFQLKDE